MIEGKIRGIKKMVEKERYCVDIVNQIHASVNALYGVAEKILAKHMEHCLTEAIKSGSERKKMKKIDEIMDIVGRLHKL